MKARPLCVLLATAAAALGQDARPNTARACSEALHAAWLREVLDGDQAGAARAYAAIAANEDPNNAQRWVAMARLAELRRLGVPVPETPAATTPPPLQPTLDAAKQPLTNVSELLERAAQSPEQLQAFTGERGRLPELRPATPAALAWMRERLGILTQDRRARQSGGAPGRTQRSNAADILVCELQGRQEQADSLRLVCFGDWKALAAPRDAAAALAKVHQNLDAWLGERDTTPFQQQLLRQLREAVDKLATTDPAAAIAFVARLPIYADRLLGAPAGTPSSR